MISHLSSAQLSECMLDQPDPGITQHLETCPACRAELENFRQVLFGFRGAVRDWSESRANAALAVHACPPESRSWMASHQLAMALLLAAVFVVASFVWHGTDNASSSDAVLLNQVDTEVSRTVPSSMEPLMKLVVQE